MPLHYSVLSDYKMSSPPHTVWWRQTVCRVTSQPGCAQPSTSQTSWRNTSWDETRTLLYSTSRKDIHLMDAQVCMLRLVVKERTILLWSGPHFIFGIFCGHILLKPKCYIYKLNMQCTTHFVLHQESFVYLIIRLLYRLFLYFAATPNMSLTMNRTPVQLMTLSASRGRGSYYGNPVQPIRIQQTSSAGRGRGQFAPYPQRGSNTPQPAVAGTSGIQKRVSSPVPAVKTREMPKRRGTSFTVYFFLVLIKLSTICTCR